MTEKARRAAQDARMLESQKKARAAVEAGLYSMNPSVRRIFEDRYYARLPFPIQGAYRDESTASFKVLHALSWSLARSLPDLSDKVREPVDVVAFVLAELVRHGYAMRVGKRKHTYRATFEGKALVGFVQNAPGAIERICREG